MPFPRVLVGCPTSEAKAYCLERFLGGLKSLTYQNFEVCLVDNSKTNEYCELLEKHAKEFEKETGKRFAVLREGLNIEKARQRVVFCRNLLRQKALDEGFDYFFSLEQDVIPPPDIIERLLSHKKEICGGAYLNLMPTGHMSAVAFKFESEENRRNALLTPLGLMNLFPSRLMEVDATGLGAILIHRSVLGKISFRVEEDSTAFDDIFFGRDARNAGYKIFLDSSMFCLHLFRPGFSKTDL
ncbi:MAG: glycosyltransferase [Candidatus Diapherotrites archaeon]|nr:glycosyltransferase [Candidatus Diapherotrites archaeon]